MTSYTARICRESGRRLDPVHAKAVYTVTTGEHHNNNYPIQPFEQGQLPWLMLEASLVQDFGRDAGMVVRGVVASVSGGVRGWRGVRLSGWGLI